MSCPEGHRALQQTSVRRVAAAAAMSVLCFAASGADADTIYLKTGRIIHAREARAEGDRLLFSQHGSIHAIPLALVDRIVEDDRVGAGEEPPEPAAPEPVAGAGSGVQGGRRPTAGGTPTGAAASSANDRLQMLSQLLGGMGAPAGGATDPAQALALLQALGGAQGTAAGSDAGLGPLLGALAGQGADTGALGADLQAAQTLLPALARMGQVLFDERAGAQQTDAALDGLLQALAAIGVSEDEILERARALGVPAEMLQRKR